MNKSRMLRCPWTR